MKLNKKKEYKNIQYFFNNRSINNKSKLKLVDKLL